MGGGAEVRGVTAECLVCGKTFAKTSPGRLYCSPECRQEHVLSVCRDRTSKRCSRCGRELPLEDFSRRKCPPGVADDRQNYCRECAKEYHRARYAAKMAAREATA